MCPDAYSYAFDDETSTFIIPQGGGFEIVFCPPGRSTNILNVFGGQLRAIAAGGGDQAVSRQVEGVARNETYIRIMNGSGRVGGLGLGGDGGVDAGAGMAGTVVMDGFWITVRGRS